MAGVSAGAFIPGVSGVPDANALNTNLYQVATRTTQPISRNTGIKQCMSRTVHYARDRITALQIIIPNYYLVSGVETAAGATTSVTASIEYPAGTFTQVSFGLSITGTIPDNGQLASDLMTLKVPIPNGAVFYTRIWRSNATAIVFTGSAYPAMVGDGFVSSGTTTPDLTMSGSVTQATVNVFQPIALVAYTNKKAVAIPGDSISHGSQDSLDAYGDVGAVARSVSPVCGYLNLGAPGESLQQYSANGSNANRRALLAYCSDIIWVFGTNDIAGGRTSANVLADFATIVAANPTKRNWICTVPPRTTSTDSWVTTANQTVKATEATRIVVNSGIRAVISGAAGCFDVADTYEGTRNGGKWAIDTGSSAPATSGDSGSGDAVHPFLKACQEVARGGKIPAGYFAGPNT